MSGRGVTGLEIGLWDDDESGIVADKMEDKYNLPSVSGRLIAIALFLKPWNGNALLFPSLWPWLLLWQASIS